MKIAALQFSPRLGELENNIARADELLEASNLEDVDLLVAPELALTGYNFPSLQAISDFLEPSCAGVTAWWASRTAQKYGLVVSVGYPEITTTPDVIPSKTQFKDASALDDVMAASKDYVAGLKESCVSPPTYWTFNSSLSVGPNGDILAHYRKTHLYYTDATWASPSPTGFEGVPISLPSQSSSIVASFAICMDLNPKAFTAAWSDYEVATQMLASKSSLLIVNTAWLLSHDELGNEPLSPCCPPDIADSPEMDTVAHWINRFVPLVSASNTTIVVIANRTGKEKGESRPCDLDNLTRPLFNDKEQSLQKQNTEDSNGLSSESTTTSNSSNIISPEPSPLVHYAGSSLVLTAGNGVVSVHGILGRGTEDVLIADTNDKAVLRYIMNSEAEE